MIVSVTLLAAAGIFIEESRGRRRAIVSERYRRAALVCGVIGGASLIISLSVLALSDIKLM